MSPALEIAGLWAAFAASHTALSSRGLRTRLVGALGQLPFIGLYSLVALAIFVPLCWTYAASRATSPWLWALERGPLLDWIVYLGMGVALTLLAAGFATPSPASLTGRDPSVRGVLRLTRPPVVMSAGLFGLLHLLPNGRAADLAFFGGFAVFALLGTWHQDRRKLADGDAGFRAFYEGTPFFPFTGRDTLRGLRELSPWIVAVGVGLTVVVRLLHTPLFGG